MFCICTAMYPCLLRLPTFGSRPAYHPRRIPGDDGVVGHLEIHNARRANYHALTEAGAVQQRRPRPYPDVLADLDLAFCGPANWGCLKSVGTVPPPSGGTAAKESATTTPYAIKV